LKKIAIIGSTGSIGTNTLRVLRELDEYEITAITAHTNIKLLAAQARMYSPAFAALSGGSAEAAEAFPENVKYGCGPESLIEAAATADVVVLSVVGIAGLPVFEYCLKNNITVILANKEAMVCGGKVVRKLMDETKTPVLPVDSELSAIFQCLAGHDKSEVKSLILTASGGPFLKKGRAFIEKATVEDALNHPNWRMGAKVTVDCATMLNKGLEIMETRWLFDIPCDKIRVVVHPESVIHSMVEFKDNSVLAQMASPDMKLPISYALTYPERRYTRSDRLNFFTLGSLTFLEPDTDRFPCLELAYEAVRHEDIQVVLNAANEVAVARFLRGEIPFTGIPTTIESAMHEFDSVKIECFDDIYRVDAMVRDYLKV